MVGIHPLGVSGPWSLRGREGSRTPSVEEFFWYHVTPGGLYKTATHEDGLESEYFDYMVLSGLTWYGSIAYALSAMETARAIGTVNMLAEFTVWRQVRAIQFAVQMAPVAAVVAVGAGYVATSDVHGGAFSVPGGAMSFGPGVYGSDPMGEFESGVEGALTFLFGWTGLV